jgi:hypothetical protein
MASTLAISLPRLGLADDEARLIGFHLDRLAGFKRKNAIHAAYYYGTQRVKHLGVSIPPALRDIETIVGWPGIAVDVLEERLDFLGWASETDNLLGLDDIYRDNDLDVEAGLGHLDALIAGTSFVIVGKGYDGEPSPLITIESPDRVTGEWDGRIRRLSSALSVDEYDEDNDPSQITLYLPNENVIVARSGYKWVIEDRDEHNLGRVPVAQLVNRPRASAVEGRSEITRPLRSYTDAAVRTLLGMEVHREFYQAPQRYLMGADESMFTDKDGNVKTGWEMVMGRMLAVPRDEDGDLPEVGQFSASSPEPYLHQVRGLAQMVSAEAAIPGNYLGFETENPPSADAIRAMEARLIKRAERRQKVFGRGWREVGYLAVLVRDGSVPEEFRTIGTDWTDAATPTRAAAADEAVKLVGAGILPADSEVTYKRIGLSPREIKKVQRDQRRARALATVRALTTPTPTPQEAESGEPDES